MKRKFNLLVVSIFMSSALLFNSCVGSFTLSNKLLAWNKEVGDKWANEVVFAALCIVQAYSVALFVDGIVLNSIEFWTGENPASADVQVKEIESENGRFTITTDANGHKIQKEGSDEVVEFVFNKEANGWDLKVMDQVTPLFQFQGDDQALVYLADGSTMTVDLNEDGMLALRQVVGNKAYFAAK